MFNREIAERPLVMQCKTTAFAGVDVKWTVPFRKLKSQKNLYELWLGQMIKSSAKSTQYDLVGGNSNSLEQFGSPLVQSRRQAILLSSSCFLVLVM